VEDYELTNRQKGRIRNLLIENKLIEKKDKLVYELIEHTDGYLNYVIRLSDLTYGDKFIASFSLIEMPGCCGILVATDTYVYEDYRGEGLGNLLNKIQAEIAIADGYSLLLVTDISDNIPQRKILDKNKWKHLHEFNNDRTLNDITISCLDLKKIKKRK